MRLFLIEVVAGRAGSGTLNPKKEFAWRMSAGRPTSAMPKPSFLCTPAFGRVLVVVKWCAVMWCDWLRDGVGCEVRWGNVVSWLRGEMRWCDVMGWDVMWLGLARARSQLSIIDTDVCVLFCVCWLFLGMVAGVKSVQNQVSTQWFRKKYTFRYLNIFGYITILFSNFHHWMNLATSVCERRR